MARRECEVCHQRDPFYRAPKSGDLFIYEGVSARRIFYVHRLCRVKLPELLTQNYVIRRMQSVSADLLKPSFLDYVRETAPWLVSLTLILVAAFVMAFLTNALYGVYSPIAFGLGWLIWTVALASGRALIMDIEDAYDEWYVRKSTYPAVKASVGKPDAEENQPQ